MWVNFTEKNCFPIQHKSNDNCFFSQGVPRISSDGDYRMGVKIKTPRKKSPGASNKTNPFLDQTLTPQESHACMPNFRASTSLVVLYSQSSEPRICGHCHEFQIALNQVNQKKIAESKISNPKISLDNPRNLKSGVPTPVPGFYYV